MQRMINPFPLFLDQRGALLDAGFIYIGEAGNDPESSPITVYWDADATQVAEQPLRTRGGFIVNGANPAFVWVDEADYSQRVKDADGNLVSYSPSLATSGATPVDYQPLSETLTALAALTTTVFGRSLLAIANSADAKALLGIVAGLSTTGGTVTGNIVRSGAGAHLYHNDPAMTSGRIFVTDGAASNPTSLPGDLWIKTA